MSKAASILERPKTRVAREADVGRKKTPPKKTSLPIAREFGVHLDALLAQKKMTVEQYSKALAQCGRKKAITTLWQIIRGDSTPPFKDLPVMAKALGLKHWQDIIPPPKK